MAQKKLKLAFYGIGQYGLQAVRIAAGKGWPIVAAYNRAGDKVGKDLGRVSSLDRDLGVLRSHIGIPSRFAPQDCMDSLLESASFP